MIGDHRLVFTCVSLLTGVLWGALRDRRALLLENLLLRQQVAVALHHNPEQPVVPAYAGPPTGAQRHRELLPQEQVLQQQRAAITERPTGPPRGHQDCNVAYTCATVCAC